MTDQPVLQQPPALFDLLGQALSAIVAAPDAYRAVTATFTLEDGALASVTLSVGAVPDEEPEDIVEVAAHVP